MTRRKSGPPLGTPRTHGLTTRGQVPPHYAAWASMKDRCYNPNSASYPNYGGRGIRVCDEWQDFAAFHAWASATYRPGLTLDRIDNDGPYAPENCRWADRTTQSRNRRGRRYLTLHGKTRSVAEWAEEIGLSTNALLGRLRIGWSVEKALTEPKRPGPATQPVLRKYAWHEADWEHSTNLEIAMTLGLGDTASASVQVAKHRKKLAPHTVGRYTGGAAHRAFREQP